MAHIFFKSLRSKGHFPCLYTPLVIVPCFRNGPCFIFGQKHMGIGAQRRDLGAFLASAMRLLRLVVSHASYTMFAPKRSDRARPGTEKSGHESFHATAMRQRTRCVCMAGFFAAFSPWVRFRIDRRWADWRNFLSRATGRVTRFANYSPIRDPDTYGFDHIVAFGSRLPIFLKERSPVLLGSPEAHQDRRDIVDASSVMLMPRGS